MEHLNILLPLKMCLNFYFKIKSKYLPWTYHLLEFFLLRLEPDSIRFMQEGSHVLVYWK